MHALIEALRDVLGLLRHVGIRLAVDKTLEVLFADVPNTMQVLSRTTYPKIQGLSSLTCA